MLPVVRKVEKELAKNTKLAHEYLPIPGLSDFREAGVNLIFGYNPDYVARVRNDVRMTYVVVILLMLAFQFS